MLDRYCLPAVVNKKPRVWIARGSLIRKVEKSINRRNPANANKRACRGTNGIEGVVFVNHAGNCKTNNVGVKMISWFRKESVAVPRSFVVKVLDPFRDK